MKTIRDKVSIFRPTKYFFFLLMWLSYPLVYGHFNIFSPLPNLKPVSFFSLHAGVISRYFILLALPTYFNIKISIYEFTQTFRIVVCRLTTIIIKKKETKHWSITLVSLSIFGLKHTLRFTQILLGDDVVFAYGNPYFEWQANHSEIYYVDLTGIPAVPLLGNVVYARWFIQGDKVASLIRSTNVSLPWTEWH